MVASKRMDFRAVALVAGVATVAALLVTGSYELTRERIVANERERLLRTFHQVLDPGSYDNDLIQSRRFVRDPALLGTDQPVEVFVATLGGAPAGVLMTPVAPLGYSGPIALLVGIAYEGVITGVRVTSHRETPGLGDAIDISRSDWITGFDGTGLTAPPLESWLVTVDGGHFDAITGATVTPRAIVAAVKNTLIYFEQHKAEIFSAASAPAEVANE